MSKPKVSKANRKRQPKKVSHSRPTASVVGTENFMTPTTQESEARGGCSVQRPCSAVIGPDHPHDDRDWDSQCARCGSSMDSECCSACGGEGITAPGELYEQDPLWYDPDDYESCHQCGGEGAWMLCISSREWCESHPLPGRENVARHTPEWFTFDPPRAKSPNEQAH